MKRRFIATIFVVLLSTVTVVCVLHFYYLRSERLRLIDRQLEAAASVVLSADLSDLEMNDIDDMEDYLSDLLGRMRVNKILLLRDRKGHIIFRGENARSLPLEPPDGPEWQTITVENQRIRLFGVHIPQIGKTLQIGVVLDDELRHWRHLDLIFVGYALGLSIVVFIIAWVLAAVLMRPLENLAEYLSYLSKQVELDKLPGSQPGTDLGRFKLKGHDAFSRLVFEITRLSANVRVTLEKFKVSTAQLAHELRTPLTVMKNTLEAEQTSIRHNIPTSEKTVLELLAEVDSLNATITSFLEWACFEHNPTSETGIFALSLQARITAMAERFKSAYPDHPLLLTTTATPQIFTNPTHLDQVLANVLSNAIRHSPATSPISIEVLPDGFSIQDRGPGIPQKVLAALGQPFNMISGGTKSGFGLGLAWVVSICKRYDWDLKIQSGFCGTTVVVRFPAAAMNG